MVEHTEEEHDVELLVECSDVIDRHLGKFDVNADGISSKPRLPQIVGIDVDTKYPRGTASFHLKRIKAAVTAYIKNSSAAQIGRVASVSQARVASSTCGATTSRTRAW